MTKRVKTYDRNLDFQVYLKKQLKNKRFKKLFNSFKPMTDKKKIKLIRLLLKEIDKDFGKYECKGWDPGCAECLAELLRGMLEWYLDLIQI